MSPSPSPAGTARSRRIPRPAVVLLITLAAVSPASGATVAPDLQARLDRLGPSERVPILVRMTQQLDAGTLPAGRAARERSLRRVATRTQASVVRRLAANGPVRRLWLVNAVAGDANARDVAALARAPEVAEIALASSVARVAALDVDLAGAPEAANWGIADIRGDEVWSELGYDGAGMVIGSIDTGVDPENPAVAGKVVAFRDFVHGRRGAYDDNGHGTHTVGTMVGASVNGRRLGVAPGARVVVAKAMDQDGVGDGADILLAAQWMTNPDGNPDTADHPAVVNNSWSSPDPNDSWFRPIMRNWLALGIVPVFATGNTGTVGSPASYPEVIAVGAMDEGHRVPAFSGRAEVVWQARDATGPPAGTRIQKPDLVGPGVEVHGAYGAGFLPYTGTSMAAPHVSAVVAMMRQAAPTLGPADIISILRETAVDIGQPGVDRPSGHGRLDAMRAMAAALGRELPSPIRRDPDGAVASWDRAVSVTGGLHVTVVGSHRRAPERLQIVVRRLGYRKIVRSRMVGRRPARFSVVLRGTRPGRYRVELRALRASGPRVVLTRVVTVRPRSR